MFLQVENTPRDYAWGRHGAISEVLGKPPTDAVEAELWLGAHPGCPARIVGSQESLRDVEPDLPFLLKVLAAGAPLSIQAHPDAAQAAAGFAREDAAGIPVEAPERNYRDPLPKPELIVALTPTFDALAGFRPAADARAAIAEIAEAVGAASDVAPLRARLTDDATVGAALVWLLSGQPGVRAAVAAIERGLAAEPALAPHVARIGRLHPGDPGVAAALLLNHVVLVTGEAIYLAAGVVHAYLDGIGVELMTASDNVLRGGLTSKHIDPEELAVVLQRAAGLVPRLKPVALDGGGELFAPSDPAARFSLALIDSSARLPLSGPAIALCTEGAFDLVGDESTVRVERGQAVLATPDERSLRILGNGALYVAR
jgi:mannose-6-phosphate isomerase